MTDVSYILLFLIAIVSIVYYYLTCNYNYWDKQGVRTVSGKIPGFGNAIVLVFFRESISNFFDKIYKKYSRDSSMVGMYFLRTPMLVVCDPELVKSVLIKEFQSFRNNMTKLNDEHDIFLGKNPFFSTGDKWKKYRAQLVNCMSQKKLKILFHIMQRVAVKFEAYLESVVNTNKEAELEIKETINKFTSELVANTAFGIESHSFETKPNPDSFSKKVESMFESSISNYVRQQLTFYMSNISSFFKISFMPPSVNNFLYETIETILQYRRNNKIILDDYLQMSIDGVDEPNLEDVVSQISAYFFDAYETTASVAAFAIYHISYQTEIQEKARKQIKEVLNKHEGSLTYEVLKELTYLDDIIYETIRLYPILGANLKICTQKVTLEGSDGLKCCLEPGHLVAIPTISLHTDDRYWKAPLTFDPDRHSEENKNEITKFTFLPFGEGPRMCAGMRYGIMTVKTVLFTLLKNYHIESSPKNQVPIKLASSFLTSAEDGVWVKLKRINPKT